MHPGTRNIRIPDYVADVISGKVQGGTTPMQVADQIDERADRVLGSLPGITNPTIMAANDEYRATAGDVVSMSFLGKYYAAKIRGATELAMFRETRAPSHQQEAIRHLRLAQGFWREYTDRSAGRYRNPLWTNRVGIVDWRELSDEVANDVTIASRPLTAN